MPHEYRTGPIPSAEEISKWTYEDGDSSVTQACHLCLEPAVGFVYNESRQSKPVCAEHMRAIFDPAGDAEKRGYLRGLREAEEIAKEEERRQFHAVDNPMLAGKSPTTPIADRIAKLIKTT